MFNRYNQFGSIYTQPSKPLLEHDPVPNIRYIPIFCTIPEPITICLEPNIQYILISCTQGICHAPTY